MNASERKKALQDIGVLPPDDDGLMPFPEDSTPQGQEPEPKPFDVGGALTGAGKAYANAYGIETPAASVNPNDPKEQLKKLLTPEFMQKLRTKAGTPGA